VRIPQDISITGVDNTDLGATQTPALTSIRTPIVETGRAAAEQLIARLEGRLFVSFETPLFELVLRGSTGAACPLVRLQRAGGDGKALTGAEVQPARAGHISCKRSRRPFALAEVAYRPQQSLADGLGFVLSPVAPVDSRDLHRWSPRRRQSRCM
jgi:hypothetical protein